MRLTQRKILISVVVISIIGFICLPMLLSFFQWSPLCCQHQEIDINSGRIRTTRFLFYRQISEKIEDSLLTKTLGDSLEKNEPEWYRVNTFSPGVHYSPHYLYHGALAQIHKMDFIWEMYNFSDEAKKHFATSILKRWQAEKDDFGVELYFRDFFKMADEKKKLNPGVVISVEDLEAVDTMRQVLQIICVS